MMTRLRMKLPFALSLALVLALLLAPLALADNVQNDVTAGSGDDTFTAGGSTNVGYRIVANNGDGQTGCNAADATPATVTINTPGEVDVSPDSLTFSVCSVYQYVEFTSDVPGDYEITVSVSDSGTGTYNTNPAKFTLHVLDVQNTSPTLTLPDDFTVEGNTTGGAIVTYTASAWDAEDGALTPTCSPASDAFFPLGATTVTCSVTDSGDLSASGSFIVTVTDTTPPSITCPADINGTVGMLVSLGSPLVSDLVDSNPSVSNDAPASFHPGLTNVIWTATDASKNSSSCTQKVTLTYDFLGFFSPIDNPEVLNVAKGGSTIPVKWALQDASGAYIGDLASFVSLGSAPFTCGTAPEALVEETVAATGGTLLRYDPLENQFIYNWATAKSWAGTCRRLTLTINDGTKHFADFKFK